MDIFICSLIFGSIQLIGFSQDDMGQRSLATAQLISINEILLEPNVNLKFDTILDSTESMVEFESSGDKEFYGRIFYSGPGSVNITTRTHSFHFRVKRNKYDYYEMGDL